MHSVDPNAEYRGVSVTKLMDRAGEEALKAISKKWKLKGKKVQIFCGGGNNGGDGFALAAELLNPRVNSGDTEVEVILAIPKKKIRTEAAQHHFKRVPKKIIQKYSAKTKFDGDILVDALLGIGVEGKLKSPFAEIVSELKKARKKLVSLDVPTGNLKPALVIAFHSSKNQPNELVVPIGIPKIAETHFGPGDVQVFFPRRRSDSHKGENGRVVIVGGSRDFVGAPIFAAQGALAGGVDLVDLWVPKSNFSAARKSSPNVLVKSFRGDRERLTSEAVPEILAFAKKNKAAIVLGPGLGQSPKTNQAVLEIAKKTRQPLVLDAGAIIPELLTLPPEADQPLAETLRPNTVLTPHSGELRRLLRPTRSSRSPTTPSGLAKKLGVVILHKGKVDAIHSPDKTRWNDAGSPTLTTGGTGDTLAGLVGALLARGVEAFEAAGIAAFLLGITAEKLALKSESVSPQMIAKGIPKIIREIQNKKI